MVLQICCLIPRAYYNALSPIYLIKNNAFHPFWQSELCWVIMEWYTQKCTLWNLERALYCSSWGGGGSLGGRGGLIQLIQENQRRKHTALNSTGWDTESILLVAAWSTLWGPKGNSVRGLLHCSPVLAGRWLPPFLQDMKAQRVSLWLLGTVLFLCSVHTRGFRRCPISMDMHHVEESFQDIKRAIVSMGSGRRSGWARGGTF